MDEDTNKHLEDRRGSFGQKTSEIRNKTEQTMVFRESERTRGEKKKIPSSVLKQSKYK